MRSTRTVATVATITFTMALAACSKGADQTALTGSKRATGVPAPTPNLDIAPQTFKRMRFVSDLEQSHSATAVAQVRAPKRVERALVTSSAVHAVDRIASAPTPQLANAATSAAATAQPSVVMASMPAPESAGAASVSASDGAMLDHGGDGGGMFGGLSTHVVIRGGHAGDGKCDPRSDAQARGALDGRPNSRMPLMPSNGVFGGGGSSGGSRYY